MAGYKCYAHSVQLLCRASAWSPGLGSHGVFCTHNVQKWSIWSVSLMCIGICINGARCVFLYASHWCILQSAKYASAWQLLRFPRKTRRELGRGFAQLDNANMHPTTKWNLNRNTRQMSEGVPRISAAYYTVFFGGTNTPCGYSLRVCSHGGEMLQILRRKFSAFLLKPTQIGADFATDLNHSSVG